MVLAVNWTSIKAIEILFSISFSAENLNGFFKFQLEQRLQLLNERNEERREGRNWDEKWDHFDEVLERGRMAQMEKEAIAKNKYELLQT